MRRLSGAVRLRPIRKRERHAAYPHHWTGGSPSLCAGGNLPGVAGRGLVGVGGLGAGDWGVPGSRLSGLLHRPAARLRDGGVHRGLGLAGGHCGDCRCRVWREPIVGPGRVDGCGLGRHPYALGRSGEWNRRELRPGLGSWSHAHHRCRHGAD